MKSLFSVAGKTVLITGGSRGIGAMLAEGFVRSGATVFISARKAGELEECRARLAKLGDCRSLIADLSTTAGVQALVDAVAQHTDTLDVLINNAGLGYMGSVQDIPPADYLEVLQVNVLGPYNLISAVLPAMTEKNSGTIINLTSARAFIPDRFYAAYCSCLLYTSPSPRDRG